MFRACKCKAWGQKTQCKLHVLTRVCSLSRKWWKPDSVLGTDMKAKHKLAFLSTCSGSGVLHNELAATVQSLLENGWREHRSEEITCLRNEVRMLGLSYPVQKHSPVLPQPSQGLNGISNTFHLAWFDRCLTSAPEWRQPDGPFPYRGNIFDASHLWHDWFSFNGPSLLDVWKEQRRGYALPRSPSLSSSPWPQHMGTARLKTDDGRSLKNQ